MKTLNTIILTSAMIATTSTITTAQEPFTLAPLPYAYDALEPVIDAKTMEIHYSKHHAAYVKNLNAAVKGTKEEKTSLENLLLNAGEYSDAIRNNAGGHYNHTLFWNILGLNKPFNANSEVGKAVVATFGSINSLNELLIKNGTTRFGSGWSWLYVTPDKKLAVCSSPNQDNPLMDVMDERGIPILTIDVWEHAYYLKYQNKRPDYLAAIIGAINWEAVNKNYVDAMNSPLLKAIEKNSWKELNEFHKVMGQTFHPSEKGDLGPIKSRSGEMLYKAEALSKSKIPASLDTPELRKAVSDLLTGSKELDAMVEKKADDKAITEKLNQLHDTFHLIQGLCNH